MFNQSDATLSRDRNLNFNLSETNYVQRLDNQKKKETAGNVRAGKFSSQTTEKEARRSKEYENYIKTFTSSSSSSNKNNTKHQPGAFRPARLPTSGGSSVAAMKKTSSVESPGRKLLRTPTQEMKIRHSFTQFSLF